MVFNINENFITNSKKETFTDNKDASSSLNIYILLSIIIIITSLIFALYLSYSCNNNTFNILHIILAILFHPFYIIYQAYKTKFFGIL